MAEVDLSPKGFRDTRVSLRLATSRFAEPRKASAKPILTYTKSLSCTVPGCDICNPCVELRPNFYVK